ncbi:SNF2 family N-terminal domain-containing protein [Suillus bovinus]|uniref:SNF2 family N-terminal domain-containing protein n=1 Tax=Suillus bovinus TaxID=48563 RepID=UPI001B87F813|nr:SNF2 family N-terminal domain-containing protein [Suillus bovinus]KAG2145979.1 SNF2 family N-terminal domain-containing protein [Suillus bovinus]
MSSSSSMSVDDVASSRKTTAVGGLRFQKKPNKDGSEATDCSAATSNVAYPSFAPPPQSRDATAPVRYHPPATPSRGIVLVPNSSPLLQDAGYHQSYRPHHLQYAQGSSATTGPNHSNLWSQSGPSAMPDVLSSSSGFVHGGGPAHASFTRQSRPWTGDVRPLSEVDSFGDEGPPRKRVNRGTPPDALPLGMVTPGSPDIQHPGQRRKQNMNAERQSHSSDESMLDVRSSLEGPSKRIVRGQRPDHTDSYVFTVFQLSHPGHDLPTLRAAWNEANGNDNKASLLLSDSSWKPQSTSTPSSSSTVTKAPSMPAPELPTVESTGRVEEVDEATKTRRAALREKAKKSSIYANRATLDTTRPPAVPNIPISRAMSPASPSTPAIMAPRRKRPKKLILSDDEAEASESEEELPRIRHNGEISRERAAFEYFNQANADAIQELTGCTPEQAQKIIELRPYSSIADLNTKLNQGKKKAGPSGISPRMFEDCQEILQGYDTVDGILEECEQIGSTLRAAIATWTTEDPSSKGKGKETSLAPDQIEEGSLSLRALKISNDAASKGFISSQPSMIAQGIALKDYQLLGINWLFLLYRKKHSCILADEMGLGKTIQVISFFALLKERGNFGPHLVIVPSSTLENWCREFARFAPSISVQTFYAGKEERANLRQMLIDTRRGSSKNGTGWEVLITTYNLAQGDDKDRKFFRKMEWDTIVFDEGHVLKNFQSQRYQALLKFEPKWRLLLTGTPLQNNLQELVSLMNFILPGMLSEKLETLRAIFKTKGDAKVTLLSQERISRAKKMMTPFVLRRRKDQVLKDLPLKTERIEWCDMTDIQRSIYHDTLQRSRKTILDAEGATPDASGMTTPVTNGKAVKKKMKANHRAKDKYLENSSNVLMDLRKAASHPMLFRKLFDDQALTSIAKQLLKEPEFKKRGAVFEYIKEDMEVMTDAELQFFCQGYKSTRKFLQDQNCYLNAGKISVLLRLLEDYRKAERKILIFSQFTQILDILQAILKLKDIKYLILTGSTAVDVRQTLVDEFTEDASIPVFLLSTKAGGMGINLTAASVVVMFDQDFNPHNDRQAQDRAYRIGQKRDVDVVKLISRGTIEEDMLRLGETKLALDEAVAGETEEGDGDKGASRQEKEVKKSLMGQLRRQLERQDGASTGLEQIPAPSS